MEDVNLPTITLRYNGVFDFDSFYTAVIDWAKNEGYMWHEKTFKHKVPSPEGAEQEFDWELTKNVTEFVRYTILISIHAWEMRDVDVEINGRKKTMAKARLFVRMNGFVKWDWQKRFSKAGKFGKFLGEVYGKAMTRDVAMYIDQLYFRMGNLHAIMKKYFDMQSKKHAYKGYLGEN